MAEITQKLVDGAGLQTAMGIMGNYSDNMDRGVVGGYNQSFPLTAATKGNIYYHKPTNRYYICINNYSGSSLTNPNSNFEELSVYTNRQRLDNLVKVTGPKNYQSGVWNDIPYPEKIRSITAIPIICDYQEEFYFVILNNAKTQFKTFSKTGDKMSVSVSFVFLRVN